MPLEFDQTLGRAVRKETYAELQISTYSRIQDAISAEQYADAAGLVDYFHEEALVCKRIFDQWLPDTEKFLRLKGVSGDDIARALDRIRRVIAPTGEPPWDRDAGWSKYVSLKGALVSRLNGAGPFSSSELLAELHSAKEAWRRSHDLDVDALLGLFDTVIDRVGEAAIGEMWEEHLIRDWFDKRYARFDVTKNNWRESFPLLVFLSFEAMHGHLCGPKREGDVEYQEFDDRIELTFDPCGSGGRSSRGEPLDGTGPRMEAPYGFKAIQGAYDFTWNKKGICTYCAHCCALTELLPAKTFGYPVRVIDPPSYPHEANEKCKYTMYKDLRSIPERAYERLGLKKPSPDKSLGSAHGPFGK